MSIREIRLLTVSDSDSHYTSSRAMSDISTHSSIQYFESPEVRDRLYDERLAEPYMPTSQATPAGQLSDLTESAQNAHNSSSVIFINDQRYHLNSVDSNSRDIFSDLIRVEINDAHANAANIRTIAALRNCKRQVLIPMWRLFQFVGWRGFGLNSNHYYAWKTISIMYSILILCFLALAYVYQILACQWKLDNKMPLVTIAPANPTTSSGNFNITITTLSVGAINWIGRHWHHNLSSTTSSVAVPESTSSPSSRVCDHVVTTYVIPNVLHFIAYCLGLYHFRVQNNEELFALSEKVFLYSCPHASKTTSQEKVIFRLKLFLAGGSIWMLTSIATHLLYDVTFVINSNTHLGLRITGPDKICPLSASLLGMDMIGYLIICSVSLIVILNYSVHAEMIIHFVDTVISRLNERNMALKVAVQDIYQIRNSITLLNSTIATMTTLIILLTGEMIVIGFSVLMTNTQNDPLVWSYRSVFVLHLLPLVIFPIIQAARVNGHCHKLRRVTLEMRTFGYCNASLLELDSVIIFMLANKSAWVKLFYIPLRPGYLVSVVALAAFVLIILLQTGVIDINPYI